MQPPARTARISTAIRQPPARQNKFDATGGITTGGRTTCSLQWTWRGDNFWYAASTYSMEHRPTKTCSKKTHTQRHRTPVVYTQVSSSSGPDSDEKKKKTCLIAVSAAHVTSGFLCLDDKKRETTSSHLKETQKTALPWCRGHVTRAVACALTSKPQPLLILHSIDAVANTAVSPPH